MKKMVVITQGEHHVSDDATVVSSTILGACVACCLWDPVAGVGGMNHILLANARGRGSGPDVNGVNAMEVLINDILKEGGARNRLKAKIFGGAQMIAGLCDIGPANGAFARSYLQTEGIPCVSESIGGNTARHVQFTPSTGAARMKQSQEQVSERVNTPATGNDMELF